MLCEKVETKTKKMSERERDFFDLLSVLDQKKLCAVNKKPYVVQLRPTTHSPHTQQSEVSKNHFVFYINNYIDNHYY